MKILELKVHPPLVLLFCLGLVYGLNHLLPKQTMPSILSGLYGFIGLTGGLIAIAGVWEFRRVKTTINPTKPEKTTQLVTRGIYQFTRNPMYLGMCLIIMAAAFKLANYYGFIALPIFIFYITEFQIKPEERIITGIFGEPYLDYKKKVRRWL
ncbi:isoprenylcysteine carboxylmethyltransferase family protein [uncultured Paraglaciecola sp.]|uniref:methyltransferase family protein n=1 Tax=uncultured Paraglaciecola sp. TaxID=1765024 RepID=UPI0030D869D9|tara:strand:+ start:53098 stop:53556 length:459 start_codon:yes stop_codon:yes gene_type:complete